MFLPNACCKTGNQRTENEVPEATLKLSLDLLGFATLQSLAYAQTFGFNRPSAVGP
jgi:hypothetical protein